MSNKHKTHGQHEQNESEVFIENAQKFWKKNGNVTLIALSALILIIGGFFAYKHYFQTPKIMEAQDKSFKAEEYFRLDSFHLALNGDGIYPGFINIAKNYSGTPAGNLANFYAGVSYLKLNQNDKAVQYLKKFSTDSKPVQQRAYKLLGDAYGDLGKYADALDYYKKAAHHFDQDQAASAEALFSAAYLAHHVLNKKNEAIELYKELKEKYPRTMQGADADRYLAALGVYKVN
jgi:tetratricopeptide (TPR) repeat protein